MTKTVISLFLFCHSILAQEDMITTYFKDKYQRYEVAKGPYKLMEQRVNDSITRKTFSKTKNGQKIWTKSYLRDQPYGVWETFDRKGKLQSTLDYHFVLKYGEMIPKGAILHEDLRIPKELDSNAKTIQSHIRKQFRYPEIAQELGTQGRVELQFTISKKGEVENLSILSGVDNSLDTECFRILYALKQIEPYKKDGQEVMVYYTVPITFKLL